MKCKNLVKNLILVVIGFLPLFLSVTSYADSVSFYLYNVPGGSVVSRVDNTENSVGTYKYNAFGSTIAQLRDQSNTYKYNGESNDAEAGLIFLRNRYYDTSLGRFITKDHFSGNKENPRSFNPYVYAYNNPINYCDPLGLRTVIVPGINLTGGWKKGFSGNMGDDLYRAGEKVDEVLWSGNPFDYQNGFNAALHTIIVAAFEAHEAGEPLNVIGYSLGSGIAADVLGFTGIGVNNFITIGSPFYTGANGVNGKWTNIWSPADPISYISALIGKSSNQGTGASHLSYFNNTATINKVTQALGYRRKKNDYYIGEPWDGGGGGGGGGLNTGSGSYYRSYMYGYYGGVSLSKTADLMLNIQDIDGAGYDEATGQMILYGKHNTSLPNMELDDLAVAVRSVYGVSKPAQDPGINIGEPVLPVPPQMPVRYDGDTFNTRFGSVMFNSDRLLKCLGLGKDNITGQPVTSGVSGYKNLLERYKDAGSGSIPPANSFERAWFTPKDVRLVQSTDGSSMIFDTATMQILTETKLGSNVINNPPAEAFASHFTQNYDAFSDEFPTLKDLKRLGKITAVVKWIKDNNIPFDLSFFETFIPQFCSTPQYTPSTTASISWTEGSYLASFSITGGVFYKLDASNFSSSTGPLADAASQAAVNARPGDTDFMWDFNAQDASGQNQQYTAIAQSLTRSKKDGNVGVVEVDMSLPIAGDNPLSFVRYYDSFYDKATGFGLGWQITPYDMRFPADKRTFTFGSGALSVSAYYQIFLRGGEAACIYTLSGLDANGKPVYAWEGGSDLLKDEMDGTFRLYRRNNGSVLFDSDGKVTKVTDRNGLYILYTYAGSKLISIGGVGKSLFLNYDGDKIISIVGPYARTVTYAYWPDGQLKTATDQEDQTTTYYYDAEKRLIKIDDPEGNHAYQAVYDDYNRASSETIASAQYSSTFSLTDRSTVITDPNNAHTTMLFDTDYKLLQSEDFLNNKVNLTYVGQNFGPSSVTDPEGKVTEYKYDSSGNTCYVKDPRGNESFFFYDSNNNLAASRDELGRDATYSYDDKNRLIEIHHVAIIDYDPQSGPPQNAGSYNQTYDPTYVTRFTYDPSNGNLLSARDAEGRIVNITYNAYGLPLTVTSANGYQVTAGYDNLSRATSVSNMGGENAAFEYDNVDRVKKITTIAGSVNYTYDKNGNIEIIYDGKNNPTHFGYDGNDDLVTVTDAEGGVTSYEYDVMGNLTKIIMSNGSTKEITYGESGRPISEINRRSTPAPQIVVLVSSLSFGSISAGTSIEKELTIYNVGDADLSVTEISANNNDFTVSPASAVVQPHGEFTTTITYTAPASGNSTGNLTIRCNDSGTPVLTVALSGEAIQQSLNTGASSSLNGMNVSWNSYTGTGAFDHYSVYRSSTKITDLTGLTPIATINNISQTSYLDAAVTLQSQYYYCVVASDAASNRLTPIISTNAVTYLNLGRVGDRIAIASSSYNEQNITVVYNNSSREYLLVYEYDASGTGINYDIYGQRLAENGTKIGSAFPVLNSGYNEKNPQLAWNSSSNEYMVACEYDSNGAGAYKIRWQRMSAAGSLSGSPIDSPFNTYTIQSSPYVVYNSADNRYLLVFDGDYSGTGKEQALFLLLDSSGNTIYATGWGLPGIRLKRCKLAYNPSLNNYLSVFEYITSTNTYVTGNMLSSIGDSTGNTFAIGAFLNNDTRPSVVYDNSRGEYVVIWQLDYSGNPSGCWTMIRKLSSTGVPGIYQPYSTTGGSMLWPNVAIFSSRNEYLMNNTILDVATNEYGVYSQRISAVDLSILTNSAINVATWTPLIERKAIGVFNPNKNEFLIAYERQLGSDCDVAAQRIGELTTLLNIEPQSMAFSADITEQTIQVNNISGQNYMHLTNGTIAPWLDVSPANVDVDGANPTATITASVNRSGLSAGSYSGQVDVNCEGIVTAVPVTMEVANLSPNSPTSPTPATGATGQAVLGAPLRVAMSWQCSDPQGDALTYDVYLSDNQTLAANADPSALVAQNQTAASCVSPALGYNKTYCWRVKSKDSGGLTALGGVWSFTTIPIAAPVLVPPTINPINTGKPSLKWNPVDGAVLYRIQIDDNPDFSSPIVNAVNITTTEYTPFVNLPDGTIYWRVAAIDAEGGEGAFSSVNNNSIIIDVISPPQVTIVEYAPDPTKMQRPTLTWSVSLGASIYHIQISATNDFSTLIFNGYVSETLYTPVSDLPEGKVWWRVSAKDLAGNENLYSNSDDFTIDITPPSAVHITSATGGLNNIEIRWDTFVDTGGDFHNFNIYRAESAIANVSGLTPINQTIIDKTITSFIDTAAASGKEYYYAITAVDTAGNEYRQVTSFGPTMVNRVPVLDWVGDPGYENDALDPESGSGSTVFTFKIKYTDLDGDQPQIHKIYIDRNGDGAYSAYDMTATGTDYVSGVIYAYTTTIPYSQESQSHSYYFEFSDGLGFAAGNITQATSAATAIHKPDVFQTLSLTIDRADWQLLNIEAGSGHLMDISNKGIITNNGDGSQTYSLKITDQGGWTSSSDKNGADIDTFVLNAVFTGDSQTDVTTEYFNETGNDDVVLSGSADRATSVRFGSALLAQNGVSVPVGAARSLWFELKAPSKDTTKGVNHSVGISISAEAS